MNHPSRQLQHGELTRIIIGTVVASEGQGITAGQLAAKLNAWGIAVTHQHMSTRLNELAAQGRIERSTRGNYQGV